MRFLEALDLGALFFFQTHHLPLLNDLMLFLTRLGNTDVLFYAATLIALGFLARGRWRSAIVLAATGLLGWGLSEGVKVWVARPRPDVSVGMLAAMPTSYSFPSGHAMNAMSVYGTAALLAVRRLRSRWARALLLIAAFALIVGVGASRLYLAVHYLTDVVGGWCGGLALALLARWVDERWSPLSDAHPLPAAAGEARQEEQSPQQNVGEHGQPRPQQP
jgi:undecaprenyl-diphosphatase